MQVVPGDPDRLLAGGAERAVAAGELDHLGDPVAGGVRRVGPLEDGDPGARSDRRRGSGLASRRARRASTSSSASASCPVALPSSRTESSTSSRVCGSTVSTSAGSRGAGERRRPWSTSTAQTAQRSWVTTRSASRSRRASGREAVEVVAAGDRCHDVRVDLGRREPLRHRGGRDDRAGARLGRGVALEGHPDDVLTRTDGEQGLRRRGEQGDDSHSVRLDCEQVSRPAGQHLTVLSAEQTSRPRLPSALSVPGPPMRRSVADPAPQDVVAALAVRRHRLGREGPGARRARAVEADVVVAAAGVDRRVAAVDDDRVRAGTGDRPSCGRSR